MRNNNRTQRVKYNLTTSSFCDEYLNNSDLKIDMDINLKKNPTDITLGNFTLKHSRPSSILMEENLDINYKDDENIENSFLPKQFNNVNMVNNKKSIKYFLNDNTSTLSF